MEQDQNRLASLFPDAAVQLRAALSNLHLAAVQLAPAEAREHDPALDQKAALLDQSYYRLLRLVNSMSSAAWLANSDPLPLQDRDIVGLVSDVCEKAGGLAPLLGLELRFACPVEHHICAVSPDVLELAVYQLLSNAFTFTPAGGSVTVELRVKNHQVLLSVADTGQGIPEEDVPHVFDRFYKVEKAHTPSKQSGTGLGLSIVKRIIDQHGQRITLKSTKGKGSTFTFTLKRAPSPKRQQQQDGGRQRYGIQ